MNEETVEKEGKSWTEEFTVAGSELVDMVKKLVHETAVRRITIKNLSNTLRHLDITSVAEVVLNQRGAHQAHPAFSKLFLQTAFDAPTGSLRVTRRPRDPADHYPTLVHALAGGGPLEFETDRTRFFGRGRSHLCPRACGGREPLTGQVGNVLDPVVSLRRGLSLGPGREAVVSFVLGIWDDPADSLPHLNRLKDPAGAQEALAAAEASALAEQVIARISSKELLESQQVAAAAFCGRPQLRAPAQELEGLQGNLEDLRTLGVDPGAALVCTLADAPGCQALIRAARIWRAQDLDLQVVVLAEEEPAPDPRAAHRTLTHLTAAQRALLASAARLWVAGDLPSAEDLACPARPQPSWEIPAPEGMARPLLPDLSDLEFTNTFGGFRDEGREYVLRLTPDPAGGLRLPPQPWANVLANEELGCIVTERGAGATWAGNSREHRLTPWFNDMLLDPMGEAHYLLDLDNGAFFSCQPAPAPGQATYEVVHGHGYTRFVREADGLQVETLLFVHPTDPVKFTRIRVRNRLDDARRLRLAHVAQLALGDGPGGSGRHVRTSRDAGTGALLAVNPLAGPFAENVVYSHLICAHPLTDTGHTGDLDGFLGPGGRMNQPAGLLADNLDGALGAGFRPCFATAGTFGLDGGQSIDLWFAMGMEKSGEEAASRLAGLASVAACEEAWEQTSRYWRRGLGSVRIQTPEPGLDAMVNGWLGYQTIACRLRGRSALYQSGGAFGFRDQLQDSLSLLPLWPDQTRKQILLHAGHQFVEGDVLHWWHQPLDRGIRTRFADDLCWLPFATVAYIQATGDEAILDEMAPYLKAPLLEPGQDEVFLQAQPSGEEGDLYDHCCRALDRGLTRGAHGLPLFGTGDWNDGMNRVGREGRGESVWMGFFLVTILDGFLPLIETRGDHARAQRYRQYSNDMKHVLNEAGWDGGWYRRGYYDDGAPLGSWENKECAIDALAQAWSVLSGVASPSRGAQVMDAVEEHLIHDEDRLICLLTPPFQDTPHDPGYIKGYVAGIRENGGQYTHAALWVVAAMVRLGRRNRAVELLNLINPVHHADSAEKVARYQVEPYVVCADVYGATPHEGRGGWTWYTGSSGWMLQVALEAILGVQCRGDALQIAPCVPDAWPGYTVSWRVPDLGVFLDGTDGGVAATWYDIHVTNPGGCSATVVGVTLDGEAIEPKEGAALVPLLRDGRKHQLEVVLGPQSEKAS